MARTNTTPQIHRNRSRWRPISVYYLYGMALDIGKITAVVLAAVVGLFLSDIVISKILPRLLEHGAGINTIAKVVFFATPEGLFIALPTALLVGVYMVALKRREHQEFTVSAGFGYDTKILCVLALLLGIVGALVSIILSGFVEPKTRLMWRLTYETVAHQAVRDGELDAGRFYQVGDATVYAATGRLSDVAGDVFLHQNLSREAQRVIVSRQILNPNTAEDGKIGLLFGIANIYEFLIPGDDTGEKGGEQVAGTQCIGCAPGDFLSPLKHLYFEKFYSELTPDSENTLRSWRRSNEKTLLELLSRENLTTSDVKEIGERVFRSALCLITPFLALLAVALTTSRSLVFVMPSAAGLVLVLSFLNEALMEVVAPFGVAATGGIIAIGVLLICSVCIALIRFFEGNLTRSMAISI